MTYLAKLQLLERESMVSSVTKLDLSVIDFPYLIIEEVGIVRPNVAGYLERQQFIHSVHQTSKT
jgi:hypothetical protein